MRVAVPYYALWTEIEVTDAQAGEKNLANQSHDMLLPRYTLPRSELVIPAPQLCSHWDAV